MAQGPADQGLVGVDCPVAAGPGNVSGSVRGTTPLRGEKGLDGIGHADQNHPEVDQGGGKGENGGFLSPMQAAGGHEHPRRFSLQFPRQPERGQLVDLVLELPALLSWTGGTRATP